MQLSALGRALGLVIACCVLAKAGHAQKVGAQQPPPAVRPKMTGTFTSLTYNREGGDVLGTEVRIVGARRGLQATVQVAEGSASDLVLVPIVTIGQAGTIRFDLPSNDLALRRFEGVVTATALTGAWTYTDGKVERISLKRGKSYWE